MSPLVLIIALKVNALQQAKLFQKSAQLFLVVVRGIIAVLMAVVALLATVFNSSNNARVADHYKLMVAVMQLRSPLTVVRTSRNTVITAHRVNVLAVLTTVLQKQIQMLTHVRKNCLKTPRTTLVFRLQHVWLLNNVLL